MKKKHDKKHFLDWNLCVLLLLFLLFEVFLTNSITHHLYVDGFRYWAISQIK